MDIRVVHIVLVFFLMSQVQYFVCCDLDPSLPKEPTLLIQLLYPKILHEDAQEDGRYNILLIGDKRKVNPFGRAVVGFLKITLRDQDYKFDGIMDNAMEQRRDLGQKRSVQSLARNKDFPRRLPESNQLVLVQNLTFPSSS